MEYLRGDTIPGIFGLTFFQVICVIGIIPIGAWYLVRYLNKKGVRK
jgi:hypothetical protein